MLDPWVLLLFGLALWAAAGMIISNEFMARRNIVTPTVVLGNCFAATINVVVGFLVIIMGLNLLLMR